MISLLNYPVGRFQLIINLMAQPDNDVNNWLPILPVLASFPYIFAPKIEKDIQKLCNKLTHAFISRSEIELNIQMPLAITKIMVKYSMEEACFFEEWPDQSDFPDEFKKKNPWKPTITIPWKINEILE